MAYTTINKSSDYFNTKLYAGNGSTQSITGVGFQPDLCWIKGRGSSGYDHQLFDAVRGATKAIASNATDAESTTANSLTSFDSDGFSLGDFARTNSNGDNKVSWNWKAGTTSGINTTGADITPSSYSMNATSGISIIKFTGNGVDGAKIAHGLGAVPELIISKRLENSNYWAVYHKSDNTDYLVLNASDAMSDAPIWKDSDPTSVYYQTDSSTSVNPSGETCVAYCFKSVTGFSKIGSYKGNGNADGTFVYTGFKPAWLLVKRAVGGTQDWQLFDSTINPSNDATICLRPNQNNGDQTGNSMDLLSTGFKNRLTGSSVNTSGDTYIYVAFAEAPLVGSNNTPSTAR